MADTPAFAAQGVVDWQDAGDDWQRAAAPIFEKAREELRKKRQEVYRKGRALATAGSGGVAGGG